MIPKNGTIVIVDDKIEEALPLITALSKDNVSVKYYDGEVDGLPVEPLADIRILFLDLQMDGISVNVDTVVGRVMSILTALISERNGPFILLVWSTKETDYYSALKEKIDANPIINPLAIKSMEKADFFTSPHDKDQPFQAKPDCIENVKEQLMSCLAGFDQLNLLMKFSNIVRAAEVELIGSLPINMSETHTWSDELSSILFSMAEAEVGYKGLTEEEVIVNRSVNLAAMNVLSDLVNDKVQRLISELKEQLNDWQIRDSIVASIDSGAVSYKLLREPKVKLPGKYTYFYQYENGLLEGGDSLKSMYKKIDDLSDPDLKIFGHQLVNIYANRRSKVNSSLLTRQCELSKKAPGTVHIRADDGLKNELLEPLGNLEEFYDQINLITVELSPSCDYSQQKWKRHRIQPGLMFPFDVYNRISGKYLNFDYYYITPVLDYKNDSFILVLDKRYFTSETIGDSSSDEAIFQFRKEMIIELQSQLGTHVSRPGIRSVNL